MSSACPVRYRTEAQQGSIWKGAIKMNRENGSLCTPKITLKESVKKYIDAVDHQKAYDIAETLAFDEKYLSNALGWRTAGSDAEHRAADYLAEKMREIGLTDVEKVAINVDKWQFNGASLTIKGTDVNIMPASYATNGTDAAGITAEIVDVGMGKAADYEGKDVKGKIVVAGVDQWNEAWIDKYMIEADLHGAAAIVTYSRESGYAAFSDDMINMQDLCSKDVMPCVSISRNQYREIAEAIKGGHSEAVLKVDNVMLPGEGTSYNVIGKIKGRSSEQQIMAAGHYDVYFNGFQDDSCAIGLILAMASGMIESGYVPENDIVFVAHAAEEWGKIGSQFDWTTGAWEMINHARPEWAGKTIAMFNFELPALYDGEEQFAVQCEPEFAGIVKDFVENSGLLEPPVNNVYPKGYNSVSVDSFCLEDGVSYRASGVPHFINVPGFAEDTPEHANWNRQHYHTKSDDRSTYNADVMMTNLKAYGAMMMYVDQKPALEMDLTATCDDIAESFNADTAKAAGIDTAVFDAALAKMRGKVEEHNAQIADVNGRYAELLEEYRSDKTAAGCADSDNQACGGADRDELQIKLDAVRAEGRELNRQTLKAFKYMQDYFIGIILVFEICIKHEPYQRNIELLDGIINALKEGKLSGGEKDPGALDLAWQLNGSGEFGYYSFSPQTCDTANVMLFEETNPGRLFWGTGKGFTFADTSKATVSLLAKAAAGGDAGTDGAAADGNPASGAQFADETAVYSKALEAQRELMKKAVESEIEAMNKFEI